MRNIYKTLYEDVIRKYSIGNLYVSNTNSPAIDQNPCEKVFDIDTFNYHLYPDKEEKYIADQISLLRTAVYTKLKVSLKFSDKWKINSRKGTSARISPIFKYICVENEATDCNINFMRFYVSKKDNSINCILGAIQFDCCHNGTLINQDIKDTGKCRINYPTTYENQKSKLGNIVEKYKKRNFCYNPPINFHIEEVSDEKRLDFISEKIVAEFLYFIQQCEVSFGNKAKSTDVIEVD